VSRHASFLSTYSSPPPSVSAPSHQVLPSPSLPPPFPPLPLEVGALNPAFYGHFGLKTLREGVAGQQQANWTQTYPCGPTCPGPCPAASPHYASCAAFVGRRHKWYWSSRWCCRTWTMATRRSPVYQATSSTDYVL